MEFLSFFLITVIRILKYAILVRILLSWVTPFGGGRVHQFLYNITEPILRLFRNLIPRMGMIDFSPIVAFFVLDLVQIGIARLF